MPAPRFVARTLVAERGVEGPFAVVARADDGAGLGVAVGVGSPVDGVDVEDGEFVGREVED